MRPWRESQREPRLGVDGQCSWSARLASSAMEPLAERWQPRDEVVVGVPFGPRCSGEWHSAEREHKASSVHLGSQAGCRADAKWEDGRLDAVWQQWQ